MVPDEMFYGRGRERKFGSTMEWPTICICSATRDDDPIVQYSYVVIPKTIVDELEQFASSWDLIVGHDIAADCECDFLGCEHIKQVFWLQTMEDRSVGIWGTVLSRQFNSMEHLAQFVLDPANNARIVNWLETDDPPDLIWDKEPV